MKGPVSKRLDICYDFGTFYTSLNFYFLIVVPSATQHTKFLTSFILSKLWSSQLWTQFKQLRTETWKSQDLNGVWTCDLAIPVRRSNQLSWLERRHWQWLHSSVVLSVTDSGFIAQLVRASHRYREITGSSPVEVLTFSGFCTQLLKLRSQLRWS